MKFARHLAAVLLAVAVIVASGVAWEHAAAEGNGGAGQPVAAGSRHRALLEPGHGHLRAGIVLNLPNILDLVRTVLIMAVLIAAVVAIDVMRRRRRRAGKTAARLAR